MKVFNCEQGSPEWLEIRKCHLFTASDAQSVSAAGVGLETTIYTKLSESLTDGATEAYKSEDMIRGNELEAEARASYEIEYGVIVDTVGFIELDEYTGCSPDGLVGEDGMIEIKCKNNVNHLKAILGEVTVESAHDWQMQMQMYVADRKWVDYTLYNPNFIDEKQRLVVKRVFRDEDKIEKIKIGIEKGIKKYLDLKSKL